MVRSAQGLGLGVQGGLDHLGIEICMGKISKLFLEIGNVSESRPPLKGVYKPLWQNNRLISKFLNDLV